MKKLLFTLAVLALGMMTSCSSDDANITNKGFMDEELIDLGKFENPNDALIGRWELIEGETTSTVLSFNEDGTITLNGINDAGEEIEYSMWYSLNPEEGQIYNHTINKAFPSQYFLRTSSTNTVFDMGIVLTRNYMCLQMIHVYYYTGWPPFLIYKRNK